MGVPLLDRQVGANRRPSRPALFLDRDGVINTDLGYVGTRDRFEWIAGSQEAVADATAAGWYVFIVTNQSGVARGLYTEDQLNDLHSWMIGQILLCGGQINDLEYCPYHPQGAVAAYRLDSDLRKPRPGMLTRIINRWSLDASSCVMVGDKATDMDAAAAAGIKGYLFEGGNLRDFVASILRTSLSEESPYQVI